jgi:hypothetical protein
MGPNRPMLQLENQTCFEAQAVPANDKDWRPIVVVVVKGTYEIGPGKAPALAREPMPIRMADEGSGKPGESSPLYESDLAIHKPGTDVVLIGEAHAPRHQPVEQLDVQFRVGPVSKVVRVIGDRKWVGRSIGGPAPGAVRPFTVMPLVYERAFGGADRTHADPAKHGWEERNPVGTGYRVNPGAVVGHPLPNLESPTAPITTWTDRPAPQGFGFIGRHWMPRRAYAGTYDAPWEQERAPALPVDFDDRYFQAAHPDLVARPHLTGRERVVATNACPNGRLEFDLPGHGVAITAYFRDGDRTAEGLLDTVVVLPERGKLVLVWRCHFDCPGSYLALEGIEVLPTGKTPARGEASHG